LLGLPGNANRPLRWLTHRGADLYKAARNGKASDTHINALFAGKTWGSFLVERKMLRANPFAAVKPVGRKRKGADKERLTIDESRRLRAYCLKHGKHDPGAVLTLGYLLLGARASELVKRDIRDLDDGGRVLRIGATKTEAGRRSLAVPDELAELLIELALNRAPAEPLFQTDGKRWSRFVARDHVRRICALASVPVLSPQALRRTQSDLATDAGVAALAVAAHLGHAGTAVTRRSYVSAGVRHSAQNRRAQLRLGTPLETPPGSPAKRRR
jgi:integrase